VPRIANSGPRYASPTTRVPRNVTSAGQAALDLDGPLLERDRDGDQAYDPWARAALSDLSEKLTGVRFPRPA
jgi:hypothetical protein